MSRAIRISVALMPLSALLIFALACTGGDTQQVQESVNQTKADYESWLRSVGSLPPDTIGMPLIIEPENGSAIDDATFVVKGWSVTAAGKSSDPDVVARVRVYLMPDGFRNASAATAEPYSEGIALVDETTGEWEMAISGSRLYRGATYVAARTEIDGVGSSVLARVSVTAREGQLVGSNPRIREPDHVFVADSGFRPGTDGYGFRNGSDSVRSDDWEVWKHVFGGSPLSWTRYQLLNHTVRKLPTIFRRPEGPGLFGGGLCYGFSSSANTFWHGTNDVAGAPQSPDSVVAIAISHDGPEFGQARPTEMREFIQRYHLTQYTSSFNGLLRSGTPAVFQHMHDVFASGDKDIPVLLLREKLILGSGHAVTPFAISEPPEGPAIIWVWDNNHPGQARPLYVDTDNWSWSYELLREGEREGREPMTWSSAKGWLEFVRTSEIVDLMHDTPGGSGIEPEEREGFFEGLLSSFTAVSIAAEPLFESGNGERFGLSGGKAYGEIRDIRYHYPDVWTDPSAHVFFLPAGSEYERSVALTEEGSYTYVVSDDGGLVEAEISGEAGRDTLAVDANIGVLEYGAGSDRERVDLSLYRPVGEVVRMMGTEDTSLSAGDTFTVMTSDDDHEMVVVNASAGERSYVSVFAVNEEALFVATAQVIEPGATHTVTVDDWDDLSTAGVVLAIDRDSDGEDDEIVILQAGEPDGGGLSRPLSGLAPGLRLGVILAGAGAFLLSGVLVLLWPRKRRRD